MCCLFGLMDCAHRLSAKQKTQLITALALESEVRGTDAAGIAYNSKGRLHIYKRPGPAHGIQFLVPQDACAVMGHTRMTTQGDARFFRNNHPFRGTAGGVPFSLAHNGVLYNDKSLRRSLQLPRTRIQTDSYVAVQILEQQGSLTPDSLKTMAETVEGSFAFTILDHTDRLYFIKGDNPLSIYYYPKLNVYLYASTSAILSQAAGRTWLRHQPYRQERIEPGEIWRLDQNGLELIASFVMSPLFRSSWNELFRPASSRGWPEQQYLSDLRYAAAIYGHATEEVDRLLEAGYTTDEIEDGLYGGLEW